MKIVQRKVLVVVAAIAALILVVNVWFWLTDLSMQDAKRIQLGMSRAEVERILGTPYLNDPIPDTTVNVWWLASDGMIGVKFNAAGVVIEITTIKYQLWFERWQHRFHMPM